MAFLEEISEIDDEPELHEFHRLKRKRKERDIDPPPCSIIGGSDEEYEDERKDPYDEDMFRISFEKGIRGFYDKSEEQETQKHMGDILQEIEVIIRFGKQSFRHHRRGYLKRRIDAHGADHDHPEHHERQDDEEYGIIDIFGLHREKRYIGYN